MSRIRHHAKGRAGGGEVSSKIGNPNVFKLAEGKSPANVHGEDGKGHLGRAKGGKISARKRGGGVHSSAKFSPAAEHKPLHVEAVSAKDGVPSRGRK